MMALAFVLCNMDKVNMSVAVIPMAKEFGWSNTVRGLVNSSFFWGYALTQIPAGWISTRIGGTRVLLVGVLVWSLGTLVAPPLAKVSLLALCVSRVVVGLGEGFAPSAVTNVMANIVPEKERASAVTLVFGSLDLGSAVGLIICGPLIKAFGWPMVFYAFAIMGVVWAVGWPFLRPGRPDQQLKMDDDETAEEIAAMARMNAAERVENEKRKKKIPWGAFFRCAPVWAVITAHFCYNWGYYALLSWLPSYFELALGLPIANASWLTLIPYVAMVAMSLVVGTAADRLLHSGWQVTHVRKLCQGIAFVGPSLCMLGLGLLTPGAPGGAQAVVLAIGSLKVTVETVIVGLLCVAFALGAWSRAGLYCNHQDMSPKYAGALLGISNTAGALPGVIAVGLVGYLLDKTGSWGQALFFPTAACQLFGLVVYTLFGSSKKQKFKRA